MELDSRSAHLVRLSLTPESLTGKTQVKRLNSIKGLFTHESLTDKTQSRRLISVKGPFTSESRTGKNTS